MRSDGQPKLRVSDRAAKRLLQEASATITSHKTRVTRELRSLFRSLDYVADNYLRRKLPSKQQRRFYEIYQQLGLAWEFLGLRCQHWDGYKNNRDGHRVCRICGKVKGADEFWILVPKKGPKRIGRYVAPNSDKTFANKRKATTCRDEIEFHGAKLTVDVHNRYKSRLLKHEFTIADERAVTLRERDIECVVYDELVCIRRPEARQKAFPKRYGAFPSELSRKTLKKFPVIFEYDERDNLLGMTILWSNPGRKQQQRRLPKKKK